MKIFIAGATGFIGSELAKALLSQGHEVRGLARSPKAINTLKSMNVIPVPGDVTRFEDVQKGVDEVDIVFHCIGVRPKDFWKKWVIQRTYIEGIRNIIRACKDNPNLKILVYLSGMLVYGSATAAYIDEDTPPLPDTTVGRCQLTAEQLLAEAHGEWGLPYAVLRPSAYYGPGGVFKMMYVDMMRRGLFRLIRGQGNNLTCWNSRDDVVQALILISEKKPLGKTYVLADDEPVSLREFADFVAGNLGVKPPGTIPYFLARIVMMDLARMNATSRRIRATRIKEELGLKLKYPTWRKGVEETLSKIFRR